MLTKVLLGYELIDVDKNEKLEIDAGTARLEKQSLKGTDNYFMSIVVSRENLKPFSNWKDRQDKQQDQRQSDNVFIFKDLMLVSDLDMNSDQQEILMSARPFKIEGVGDKWSDFKRVTLKLESCITAEGEDLLDPKNFKKDGVQKESVNFNGEQIKKQTIKRINSANPSRDYLIVLPYAVELKRESGIILTDVDKREDRETHYGKVVAVGEGCTATKKGDNIYFSRFAGKDIVINDDTFIQLKETEKQGHFEPELEE